MHCRKIDYVKSMTNIIFGFLLLRNIFFVVLLATCIREYVEFRYVDYSTHSLLIYICPPNAGIVNSYFVYEIRLYSTILLFGLSHWNLFYPNWNLIFNCVLTWFIFLTFLERAMNRPLEVIIPAKVCGMDAKR